MKKIRFRLATALLVVAVAVSMLMPAAASAADNGGAGAMLTKGMLTPVTGSAAVKGEVNAPSATQGFDAQSFDPQSSKVKVTFNTNGGLTASTVKMVTPGKKVGTLPPVPVRIGYKFQGWYTKKYDGDKITKSTIVSKKVSYYAHWAMTLSNGSTDLWVFGSKKKVECANYPTVVFNGSTGYVTGAVYRSAGSKLKAAQVQYYEIGVLSASGYYYYCGITDKGKKDSSFTKGTYYKDKNVALSASIVSSLNYYLSNYGGIPIVGDIYMRIYY